MKQKITALLTAFLMFAVLLTGCQKKPAEQQNSQTTPQTIQQQQQKADVGFEQVISTTSYPVIIVRGFKTEEIPPYDGVTAYTVINKNQPFFTKEEIEEGLAKSFERYSDLDSLGRCGIAYARIGKELMPTEPRGKIGMIKPSGWKTIKYDFVDGRYLYNRCHLIGFQLAGENANPLNLITGTRYLNVIGMLPFENDVAQFVKKTDRHVLYRVTPIYKDNELVARGVLIEALSLEDGGKLHYNVFCHNVQPNVVIDYATGNSRLADGSDTVQSDKDAKAIQKSIERHKKKEAKKNK